MLNRETMEHYIADGLMDLSGGRLRATDRGLLLLDTIVPDLFDV
jgi:coproporphyrinogen III oxidase-like Fe-S oxidoreductase